MEQEEGLIGCEVAGETDRRLRLHLACTAYAGCLTVAPE